MAKSVVEDRELLGCVIGESGDTYVVKLAPTSRIVIITGPGIRQSGQEWRFTFRQVLESAESLLFLKVADLLRAKGKMS